MIDAFTLEIGTEPTLIFKGKGSKGSVAAVRTPSGAGIRVGGAGVDMTEGWLIDPDNSMSTNLDENEEWYGIAAAPVTVNVFVQGA